MQGNTTVIDYLDRYLQTELRGHRQYLRNARYCAHWGLRRLERIQAAYAEEETRHAARPADRLLFLEAVPTFDAPSRFRKQTRASPSSNRIATSSRPRAS